MPTFPPILDVPREQSTNYSVQFTDHRGKVRSTRLTPGAGVTTGLLETLRNSMGNGSNAVISATNLSQIDRILNIADPDVEVFDEAYSSIDHVAVFQFQDNTGDVQTLEVPAPDLSMFESDGETINTAQSYSAAIINAAIAALNEANDPDPDGTYVYRRGYLAVRASERRRPRVRPVTIDEPEVGENPSPLPGS